MRFPAAARLTSSAPKAGRPRSGRAWPPGSPTAWATA